MMSAGKTIRERRGSKLWNSDGQQVGKGTWTGALREGEDTRLNEMASAGKDIVGVGPGRRSGTISRSEETKKIGGVQRGGTRERDDTLRSSYFGAICFW